MLALLATVARYTNHISTRYSCWSGLKFMYTNAMVHTKYATLDQNLVWLTFPVSVLANNSDN